MEIIKSQIGLSLLDEDGQFDDDVAWNIAQLIADMEGDIRLAKGKFWNRCKDGTRVEICTHFEWNYENMKQYGRFARLRATLSCDVTFTDWKKLRKIGIVDGDMLEILGKWGPDQTNDEKKAIIKQIKEEYHNRRRQGLINAEPDPIETPKQKQEKDAAKNTAAKNMTMPMNQVEAFATFGIYGMVTGIDQDIADLIYKYKSKTCHPDAGGSEVAMSKLNEARKIINKFIKGVTK
jgi:hypothetical protein